MDFFFASCPYFNSNTTMKIAFFFFFNLFCYNLMAQISNIDLIGVYHFTRHNIPDTDQPSKCDCHYKKEILTLNEDATFEYIQQKGRLSPAKTIYWGTWTLEDQEITLHSTDQVIPNYIDPITKTTTNKKEKYSKKFLFEVKSSFKVCQKYSDFCLKK